MSVTIKDIANAAGVSVSTVSRVMTSSQAVDQEKKERKWFRQKLINQQGEKPDREYTPERYVRIPGYYEHHKKEEQIDDITWNDLGMDDVFMRMNYTYSASGEEYLYYKLRNVMTSKQELEHLESIITFFRDHPEERVKTQYLMSQLGYHAVCCAQFICV